METCSVPDCDAVVYAKLLCRRHYDRQRVAGTTDPPPPVEERRRVQADKIRKYRGPCAVEGCERPAVTRGWCQPHYMRWRRTGDTGEGDVRTLHSREGVCAVEGCDAGIFARGWCMHHYENARLRGDPLAEGPGKGKRPYPPKWEGAKCLVEGCERSVRTAGYCTMHYDRIKKDGDPGPAHRLKGEYGAGSIDQNGYRVIPDPRQPGRRILEHRYKIELLIGRPLLPTENVHHINGDRADNRTDGPLVNGRSGNLELWSTSQPAGQHIEDKVRWAREIIALYGGMVPE